jgi:putative phage-type endonuclease
MEGNVDDERRLKRFRNKVKTLQKKPQPEQRTPEWYAARHTRVTASEAASCLFKSQRTCEEYVKAFDIKSFKYKDTESLNHYETREDYIIKKCASFYGENVFKDSIYTLWGKKYEEVANRVYCQLNNTTVIEFGLLPHPRLKWLAASPDGITPDGIMLEIKCPKSRKINENEVPIHYWVQTQIQLEVTDLDFCDFFECEIEEFDSEQDFIEKPLVGKQAKGILLQIANSGPDPKFIYPPIEIVETDQYIDWKNKLIEQDPTLIPTYYFISKYNNQRVARSKTWFANVKDDIKNAWNTIMHLQASEENFTKYKQSIHLIKSKAFFELYNKTTCEIEDDISSFVFEDNQDTDNTDTQMINVDTEIGNSDTPMEITKPQNNVVCLIDD